MTTQFTTLASLFDAFQHDAKRYREQSAMIIFVAGVVLLGVFILTAYLYDPLAIISNLDCMVMTAVEILLYIFTILAVTRHEIEYDVLRRKFVILLVRGDIEACNDATNAFVCEVNELKQKKWWSAGI